MYPGGYSAVAGPDCMYMMLLLLAVVFKVLCGSLLFSRWRRTQRCSTTRGAKLYWALETDIFRTSCSLDVVPWQVVAQGRYTNLTNSTRTWNQELGDPRKPGIWTPGNPGITGYPRKPGVPSEPEDPRDSRNPRKPRDPWKPGDPRDPGGNRGYFGHLGYLGHLVYLVYLGQL